MRLLITRPAGEAQAAETALRAQGHDVLACPLISIEKAPDQKLNLAATQGFIVTDGDGAKALSEAVGVRTFPVFCDSAGTAATLAQLGFKDVRNAQGDAAQLARLIERSLNPKLGGLAYVCSTNAPINLSAMLNNAGFAVRPAALYEIKRAAALPEALARALKEQTLDAAIFFSADEARAFSQLVQRAELDATTHRLLAIVAAPVAAAPLAALKFARVVSAPRSDAPSVLATVDERLLIPPQPEPQAPPEPEPSADLLPESVSAPEPMPAPAPIPEPLPKPVPAPDPIHAREPTPEPVASITDTPQSAAADDAAPEPVAIEDQTPQAAAAKEGVFAKLASFIGAFKSHTAPQTPEQPVPIEATGSDAAPPEQRAWSENAATVEPEPAVVETYAQENARPLDQEASPPTQSVAIESVAAESSIPEPVEDRPQNEFDPPAPDITAVVESQDEAIAPVRPAKDSVFKKFAAFIARRRDIKPDAVESFPAAPEDATPEPALAPEPIAEAAPEPVASESVMPEPVVAETIAPEPETPEPETPEPETPAPTPEPVTEPAIEQAIKPPMEPGRADPQLNLPPEPDPLTDTEQKISGQPMTAPAPAIDPAPSPGLWAKAVAFMGHLRAAKVNESAEPSPPETRGPESAADRDAAVPRDDAPPIPDILAPTEPEPAPEPQPEPIAAAPEKVHTGLEALRTMPPEPVVSEPMAPEPIVPEPAAPPEDVKPEPVKPEPVEPEPETPKTIKTKKIKREPTQLKPTKPEEPDTKTTETGPSKPTTPEPERPRLKGDLEQTDQSAIQESFTATMATKLDDTPEQKPDTAQAEASRDPAAETGRAARGGGRAARLLAEDAADARALNQRFKAGSTDTQDAEAQTMAEAAGVAARATPRRGVPKLIPFVVALAAAGGAVWYFAPDVVSRFVRPAEQTAPLAGAPQNPAPAPAAAPDQLSALQARTEALAADIAAMNTRLSAVEQRESASQPDAGAAKALSDRLAALETAVQGGTNAAQAAEGLETSLVNQARQLTSVTARLATLEAAIGNVARLEDLATRLTALEGKSAEANSVLALADRLAALEKRDAVAATALVLATAQLREAVVAGRPYAIELETILQLTARADVAFDPAALKEFSAKGLVRSDVLKASFADAAAAAVRAGALPDASAGWMRRALDRIYSIVSIRPFGSIEGTSPGAIVARAEQALKADNLLGAVTELDALSGPANEAMAPWLTQAKARVAADQALDELSARSVGAMSATARPQPATAEPVTP